MSRKDVFNLCSAFTCLLLLSITLSLFWRKYQDRKYMGNESNSYISRDANMFIEQRNKLSKLLNQKQQIIGRMKCEELNRTKVAKEETTDAGGWCPIASKTKHLGFDASLATALASFFEGIKINEIDLANKKHKAIKCEQTKHTCKTFYHKGKNVASFGDGPGRFKQAILDVGRVKTYDAFDGAPFCEVTSEGRVQFLDLSLPQYGLPVYDWILCLEVAEHIPKTFEEVLLSNIVRHASRGIILSWAVPGQYGYSHVNNQPAEYVISCMDRLGFELHTEYTTEIRGKAKNTNLKRNINVFVRKEQKSIEELSRNA